VLHGYRRRGYLEVRPTLCPVLPRCSLLGGVVCICWQPGVHTVSATLTFRFWLLPRFMACQLPEQMDLFPSPWKSKANFVLDGVLGPNLKQHQFISLHVWRSEAYSGRWSHTALPFLAFSGHLHSLAQGTFLYLQSQYLQILSLSGFTLVVIAPHNPHLWLSSPLLTFWLSWGQKVPLSHSSNLPPFYNVPGVTSA
jgi:hypothetical protein